MSLASPLQSHGSLAAAYIRLLRHFDNGMDATTHHLRISVSYAYRRCAQARCLAARLQHIPIPGTDVLPEPWRGYRLWRQEVQLTFAVDEKLPVDQKQDQRATARWQTRDPHSHSIVAGGLLLTS